MKKYMTISLFFRILFAKTRVVTKDIDSELKSEIRYKDVDGEMYLLRQYIKKKDKHGRYFICHKIKHKD